MELRLVIVETRLVSKELIMAGADSTTSEFQKMHFWINLLRWIQMENIIQSVNQIQNDLRFKWQVYLQEEF